MKDIIKVVMISLTPYRPRSHAGTMVHAAPTAMPSRPEEDPAHRSGDRVEQPRSDARDEGSGEQELAVRTQVPESGAEGDDQPGSR